MDLNNYSIASRMLICGAVLADARRTGNQPDSWFSDALRADLAALKDKDWSVKEWTEFWKPAAKLGLFVWKS